MNLSDLTVSVSSEIVEDIAAIVSIDKGSVTASDFSVTTDGEKAPVAIAVTANTSADNINISNSNIIVDIPADADQSLVDKVTSDSSTALSYDAASAEEFSNALVEYGRARLTSSISIDSTALSVNNDECNNTSVDDKDPAYNRDVLDFVGNYTIDLNGNTLTSTVLWDIENNSSMSINGEGDLVFNLGNNSPSICVFESGKLSFDNVTYTSNSDCVYLVRNNDGMQLDVTDSSLTSTGGYYVISTNASAPDVSKNLIINISNSKITKGKGTALLLNVMSDVTISSGSEITGGFQALIARGGNYRIEDSTLLSTGGETVNSEWEYFFSPDAGFPSGFEGYKNWGSGNMVAYAALVIGNATPGSYDYPTTVELYNSTATMTTGDHNPKAKDIFMASANDQKVILITDDSEVVSKIIELGEYETWRGDTCYVQIEGQTEQHLTSN